MRDDSAERGCRGNWGKGVSLYRLAVYHARPRRSPGPGGGKTPPSLCLPWTSVILYPSPFARNLYRNPHPHCRPQPASPTACPRAIRTDPTVEYVTCKICKSSDTLLGKENRLFFVTCESCGSRNSVSTIKAGFQAQVGRRVKAA